MEKQGQVIIVLAWVVATVATLGSLFFSDVMEFIPCSMCWYQRIAMYPLVFILAQGLLMNSYRQAAIFSTPLVIAGWFWAFYQCLLIFEVIEEDMVPCSQGVPCSVTYIQWFGFIDIPVLSFMAFSIIGVLLLIFFKKGEK